MNPLEEELRRRIEEHGPISVAEYMATANAHYYATRDPLGRDGDFITAPEISQMFGELVGAWLADLWDRAGRPVAAYVELGPGRGTLAADALRVLAKAGLSPPVHFVETSPVLRDAQKARVPTATWHDDIESLPGDRPLLVVANEFFDALPVHQFGPGAIERYVSLNDGRFVRTGDVERERSPAAIAIVRALVQRLERQGGAALIVDYGYDRPTAGDTLQAVSAHIYADPWVGPGSRDLSAHVDFQQLASAARAERGFVLGPVAQGAWLRAMGIDVRAASLAKAAPERAAEIAAARDRLMAPEQMGRLFKVIAFVAGHWPEPAGF
jgi:SAM-dependent MidA family methyltransferase